MSANKITNEEQLLLENKVNSVQGKVFINDGTPSGTTIARQTILTDSSGNMIKLQDNLTTGELSLQGINSSGQRIFEKSLTPYPANALIGASSSSKMLVGNGVVSKVASKLPYNPVLKSPIKYPNLTYDENKFLNDYMGKEIPGKIVSKYNDVNKYEYNATTNPGPLSIGDNPQINNFYGGRYNKRILEKPEVYFRAGDSGYKKEFGSYYTKDFPKSSIQVRTDSAVKLYWTDEDGILTGTSPLNRVYMIEFPVGTEVYEGPIGYQEGRYLGGLENEQIYIEKAWKKGTVKSSFPLEKKKELVIPGDKK